MKDNRMYKNITIFTFGIFNTPVLYMYIEDKLFYPSIL